MRSQQIPKPGESEAVVGEDNESSDEDQTFGSKGSRGRKQRAKSPQSVDKVHASKKIKK